MAKPPSSVRSVRLPDELWDRLKAKAALLGKNLNAGMAEAAERWLDTRDFVVGEGPAPMRKGADDDTIKAPSTPAQQMTERELRDAFWRKTGVFNPKGKTR